MKLEPSVYKQLRKKNTDHRVENLQLLWRNLHYEKFKTDILGYGQCYKAGILHCVLQAHLKCALPRHDENTNYNQESNPSRKLVWKTSLNVLLQTKPSCVLTLLSRCRERLMQKIKGDMAFREGQENKRLCKYDPWCFSCAGTHKEKPSRPHLCRVTQSTGCHPTGLYLGLCSHCPIHRQNPTFISTDKVC